MHGNMHKRGSLLWAQKEKVLKELKCRGATKICDRNGGQGVSPFEEAEYATKTGVYVFRRISFGDCCAGRGEGL